MDPSHATPQLGVPGPWWDRLPHFRLGFAPSNADVEAALAPFDARPHWGKLFVADGAWIAPLYERLDDFRRLMERLDARGAFRNAWLERAGVASD
jgi:hypothetical protein